MEGGIMPASRRKRKKDDANKVEDDSTEKIHSQHSHSQSNITKNKPKAVNLSSRFVEGKRRYFSGLMALALLAYSYYYYSTHTEVPEIGHGAYDLLYLPNLVLLMSAFGMLFNQPLIIATSIACVSYSHISWIFDVIYWVASDQFPIGRAMYLEGEDFEYIYLTTLHQGWFLPLCLTVLYVDYPRYGVPVKAWGWSLMIYLSVGLFGWFISGSNGDIYDFNTGHEFWLPYYKEAYTNNSWMILHYYSHSLPQFIGYTLFEATILNGVFFSFIKIFSLLLLEDLPEKIAR